MVSSVFTIPFKHQKTDATPCEFIGGAENVLVCAAANSIVDTDSSYDSLLFYGPTGSGKSLLARGLSDQWKEHHPTSDVLVTTGADFARQFGKAVKSGNVTEFRRMHREVDFFVLDGLCELSTSENAQVELTSTLDAFGEIRGRAILTSSQFPAAMRWLLPALKSRLSSSLSVPLRPPTATTRQAICLRLSSVRNIQMAADTAKFLADQLPMTVPQLRHAILDMELSLSSQRRLTTEYCRDYINNHRCTVPVKQIITATARHFAISEAVLKSASRRAAVVTARGVAIYLIRSLTGISFKQIGKRLGGRDHTTIMHAYHKIEKLLHDDAVMASTIENLRNSLNTKTEQRDSNRYVEN